MANKNVLEFVTPVGRLVNGSVYEPQTTDKNGVVKTFKTGKNAGQPRTDYVFRVAIPKAGEPHWNKTDWGSKIWAVGHVGYPNGGADRPGFAWKVIDGDSTVPTATGLIPAEAEGWPGNWVLTFTGSYAPQICNHDGSKQITEAGFVYLGCYVQVAANVVDNAPSQTPGVYLNHGAVAFAAHGERITYAVIDTKTVGFGKGVTLPAGASPTPIAGMSATPPAASPPPPPASLPPAHNGILNPGRRMTVLANDIPYESWIGQGWTDAQLIEKGLMLP